MSFSSNVKEELSKNPINNKSNNIAELYGYLLTGNAVKSDKYIDYLTENEFNIERFYKILYNLQIDYEPIIKGKTYVARIKADDVNSLFEGVKFTEEQNKQIIKGTFCGAGSINDPNKKYHLEVYFGTLKVAEDVIRILNSFGITAKTIKKNDGYSLYMKDGEEISKFLALIGANKSVLEFEQIRVMRDMKNNVNRQVNCETANLNKVIDAALSQIEDIKFIKKMNKFEMLPVDLKIIADLRCENPEASLKELGEMLEPKLGKSGVNHRLKKIQEIAEDLK